MSVPFHEKVWCCFLDAFQHSDGNKGIGFSNVHAFLFHELFVHGPALVLDRDFKQALFTC